MRLPFRDVITLRGKKELIIILDKVYYLQDEMKLVWRKKNQPRNCKNIKRISSDSRVNYQAPSQITAIQWKSDQNHKRKFLVCDWPATLCVRNKSLSLHTYTLYTVYTFVGELYYVQWSVNDKLQKIRNITCSKNVSLNSLGSQTRETTCFLNCQELIFVQRYKSPLMVLNNEFIPLN